MATDIAMYVRASRDCPFRNMSIISSEKVEKVVKPPQNPLTRSTGIHVFSYFER